MFGAVPNAIFLSVQLSISPLSRRQTGSYEVVRRAARSLLRSPELSRQSEVGVIPWGRQPVGPGVLGWTRCRTFFPFYSGDFYCTCLEDFPRAPHHCKKQGLLFFSEEKLWPPLPGSGSLPREVRDSHTLLHSGPLGQSVQESFSSSAHGQTRDAISNSHSCLWDKMS